MNSDTMFGQLYEEYYSHRNSRWASFVIDDVLEQVSVCVCAVCVCVCVCVSGVWCVCMCVSGVWCECSSWLLLLISRLNNSFDPFLFFPPPSAFLALPFLCSGWRAL